jgi:hypothetical protein
LSLLKNKTEFGISLALRFITGFFSARLLSFIQGGIVKGSFLSAV